jgi:hypothetical protein
MAARRKPARKPAARRAATGTAKIRVHTDEYGRKVYTVVGTKKFAYTLAKAKELAAKKAPKKRASSKKSTALTTTRKRTTVAKRKPTTRRRTTGAKRNAKGQFVKAGRKTAGRRTTRRNPTGAERLAQSLDDRIFSVYVRIKEKVGEREKKVRSIRTGKMVLRRVPEYTDVVYTPDLVVRGRSAAIREAERLANEAIGAANFRHYFYREDVDRGEAAGTVEYQIKSGTDNKYGGTIAIEPLPEDFPVYKKRGLAVGGFI